MEQTELSTPPPTAQEIEHYQEWWSRLSLPWKTAYNQVMLRRTAADAPPVEILHQIWNAPALRFAGPTAPFPNMSFELEDMEGVVGLDKLEIFVFTFFKITSIETVARLPQLKSLFVFNNQITSLDGVEALSGLQELYFNVNQVMSLRPLEHLTALKALYCNYNRLQSLEGIGQQHIGTLKKLVCLPNPELPDAEIIRMEKEVGIRCIEG